MKRSSVLLIGVLLIFQVNACKKRSGHTSTKAASLKESTLTTWYIKLSDEGKLKIKKTSDGYMARINDLKIKLKIDKYIKVLENDKLVASAKNREGNKLILRTPAGKVYLAIKLKDTKVKVSLDDPSKVWEFKLKGNKIKVRLGDNTLGKVKYYPDKHKTKAKDASNNTLAKSYDFKGITPVMAPFVLKDWPLSRRIVAALLLLYSLR